MTVRDSSPLRITVLETTPEDSVVLLEGHLTEAGWTALREVRARCGTRRVCIDLGGLRYAELP